MAGKKEIRLLGRKLVRSADISIESTQQAPYTVVTVLVRYEGCWHYAIQVAKCHSVLDVFDETTGMQVAVGRALKRIIIAILEGRVVYDQWVNPLQVKTPYGVIRGAGR